MAHDLCPASSQVRNAIAANKGVPALQYLQVTEPIRDIHQVVGRYTLIRMTPNHSMETETCRSAPRNTQYSRAHALASQPPAWLRNRLHPIMDPLAEAAVRGAAPVFHLTSCRACV